MAATGKGWRSGSRLTDRSRIFAVVLPIAAILACGAEPSSASWTTLPNAPVAPSGPERFDDVCFASPDSGWIVDRQALYRAPGRPGGAASGVHCSWNNGAPSHTSSARRAGPCRAC
jgi:hypothetical protein